MNSEIYKNFDWSHIFEVNSLKFGGEPNSGTGLIYNMKLILDEI
jgi:hypothetical protein